MMTDNGLMFFSKDGSDIKPCKKEAFRYMGYKAECGNEEFEKLYEKCNAEYKKAASYKAVMCKVPIVFKGNNIIDFGFCEIENENLYKNLSGCDGAYVFAATSGVAVDRLIMRYSSIAPAEAMICDCIASSAIEVWCDEINNKVKELYETKPRFSPGYGGVSLEYQRDILTFLDAQRKTGITLNDAFMMKPVKSVTAFIGIRKI